MTTSTIEIKKATALRAAISDESLTLELADGRTVSAPLAWYPRLQHGSAHERTNWRLIGGGEGVHWPDLDEDISVQNILQGKPSGESQTSLQHWLQNRLNK